MAIGLLIAGVLAIIAGVTVGGRFGSRGAGLLVGGGLLTAIGGLVLSGGDPEPKHAPVAKSVPQPVIAEPQQPKPLADPLGVGSQVPPFRVAGWLQNEPPKFGTPGVRGYVVDVWGTWCPECKKNAANLIALFERVKGQGIAFVTVTTDPKPYIEKSVREHGMPWPVGYEMSAEAAADLGTPIVSTPFPGHMSVMPTIYVLDGDGKVCWSDARARSKHADPKTILVGLEDALRPLLDVAAK